MTKTKIQGLQGSDSFFPNEERDIASLKKLFESYEELIVFAARLMHTESMKADEIERQQRLLHDYQIAINIFTSNVEKLSAEVASSLLEGLAEEGNIGAQLILNGIVRQNRRTSKKVVSQRVDQQLKPLWIQHCKDALSADIEINRLADLFVFNSCSTDFKKSIDERTLKRWAKEVGVVLKPGRPAKGHK